MCVALQKALFKVVGMHYSACKPIVERRLKGEQSNKSIEVDFVIPHTGSFVIGLLQSLHLTAIEGQDLQL
jgi:hypothetical protein